MCACIMRLWLLTWFVDGDVNIYMAGGGLGATNACTKEVSIHTYIHTLYMQLYVRCTAVYRAATGPSTHLRSLSGATYTAAGPLGTSAHVCHPTLLVETQTLLITYSTCATGPLKKASGTLFMYIHTYIYCSAKIWLFWMCRLETEFNYENSNPIITQMCQVRGDLIAYKLIRRVIFGLCMYGVLLRCNARMSCGSRRESNGTMRVY